MLHDEVFCIYYGEYRVYVIASRLCEYSTPVRFEKRAAKTPQQGHKYGDILLLYDMINMDEWFISCNWHELCSYNELLDLSNIYRFLVKYAILISTMNELLPHLLLCWYAYSYRVMPSSTRCEISQIFRDRAIIILIYLPISAAMFSTMIHRLMWTHFFWYILDIRFYFSLFVNSTSHFSNFVDFKQLQIPSTQTKCYEMLPAYSKTPYDTTRKIANRYFDLKYHFSTLQKKSDYFWTRVYFKSGHITPREPFN